MSRLKPSKTGTADKNDWIGPPSEGVDLAAFLQEAISNAHLWHDPQNNVDISIRPFESYSEQELSDVADRCSTANYKADIQGPFEDDSLLTELKIWQWARIYAGTDEDEALARAVVDGSSSNNASGSRKRAQLFENGEDGQQPSRRGRAKKSQANVTNEDDLLAAGPMNGNAQDIVIDPDLTLGQLPEASTSAIQIEDGDDRPTAKNPRKRKTAPMAPTPLPAISTEVGPIRDAILNTGLKHVIAPTEGMSYLRRSRQSDYQSLSHVRTANAQDHFKAYENVTKALEAMSPHDNPPEVLVHVTYQPIGHKMALGKENMTLPHRLQKTVFLGSQTLADVKDSLVSSAAVVPKEVELDEIGPDGEKKYRYTTEQWRGGGVVAIDRRLYADTRHGQADIAQQLLDRINRGDWPVSESASEPVRSGAGDIVLSGISDMANEPHIDPNLYTSHHESSREGNSASRNAAGSAPVYRLSGRSMHETRLYDVIGGIKLGQPCWLVQQGDDEHFFTFDEVRLMHPTDPPASIPDAPSATIYPITTFLSRLNVSKCTICEKDPATRVTVNDDLAGVTPCPICDVCFEFLHVDEEGARNHGADVIPVMEEL